MECLLVRRGERVFAYRALRFGRADPTPLAGFDSSCPGMAQGPNRFERARRFHRYITEKYAASHTFVPVPLCGHNARCMFTAERALPVPSGRAVAGG